MVMVCEEVILKREPSNYEFTIYRYLIEELLEKIELVKCKSEQLKEIQEKIDSYIFTPILSPEKIEELYQMLLEKINDAFGIVNTEYDEYAVQLIDILNLSLKRGLDASYFESFTYEEESIVTKFFKAIQFGDYVTATNIIMSQKWVEKTKIETNRKYFILYKRLLAKINRIWHQNPIIESSNEVECEQQPMKIDHLRNLKRLVKNRDYVGAYSYYQEYLSEDVSLDTKQVMDVLLLFLTHYQKEDAEDIFFQYKQSFSRDEFAKAREFLKQYESFIRENSLNRNIDYHYSRIDVMEQEISTSSFVEKEQLYDYAKYCLKNKAYQGCIDSMNRYISLDEDLSAKGYLLRGRAYEFLKHYDQAKADYEKSLSIISEPNAFYRLGKVSRYQGNIQDSLNHHLEYEKRRPYQDFRNMFALYDLYQELGNDEVSQKYYKLAEQIAQQRKPKR